ncbi:MAG: hypothetical protein KKH12_00060 [Gammaproteobacteria bacterium]|nr:hypothetical protein [Gammaproteobacteria bacterium]
MSKAVFYFGLLMLSGCSGLFEKQPKGPWAILKHEYRQCLNDLKRDSELDAIADKVTLDTVYDRDEYFDLLSIEDTPTRKEKVAIKKWATKLEHCYKIKARAYVYEPRNVALWSAALDSDQLVLVLELQKGNLSYGQFAAKRLEVDTAYRGKILQAVAADYKKPEYSQPPNNTQLPRNPVTKF